MANDGANDGKREYRTAELAEAAGITVRTLRFYRERGLLPAPRREGRIAWYGEPHLARLRTVAALLDRGHTLGGIAELIAAFEGGRGVAELLGTPWSQETSVRLTPEELADHFAGEVTPENLAAALDIGYLAVDGEQIVHISSRLLEAATALVRAGIPLSAVLTAAREVRAHADALAGMFSRLVHEYTDVASDDGELTRLRPLARTVVDAEFSLAMDRRLRGAGARDVPGSGDATACAPPKQL
ncbi:MerR family transcriptional regulator [Streptomyces hesseae]|uniref:MerR family transcriptional regulator n=1 Tax=Streptomyces hesseae TaxID=3075519 RepID=A0ABU2SIE8_9ACTN|nr:MerR family transcriptional regulator [Streptomyces sp. DSM 40473]MDT0448736.1 MerR family transcriptional regulator [Streptomyces sp. DSM 40473]